MPALLSNGLCCSRVKFSTAEGAQASIAATDGCDYKGLAAKGGLLASRLARAGAADGEGGDDGGGGAKRPRVDDGVEDGEARKRGRVDMADVADANDSAAASSHSGLSEGPSQARGIMGEARMSLLEQRLLEGNYR